MELHKALVNSVTKNSEQIVAGPNVHDELKSSKTAREVLQKERIQMENEVIMNTCF